MERKLFHDDSQKREKCKSVASSLSLSDLKHSIQPTLRATNCFVKINDWEENRDSRTTGYLRNLHPIHQDRDIIQKDVSFFLDSVQPDDSPPLPVFKIVPSSATESQSNKNLSSRFLAITCKNKADAQIMQKALLVAYSTLSTPIDVNLGSFIPASAKYTDKELFRKLIRRQNQYLAGHRNIPMDGICENLLNAMTSTGRDLREDITLGAQILRMDINHAKNYLGRYNFSTSEQHYLQAIEWIDGTLPRLIASIQENDRGLYAGSVDRVVPRVPSSGLTVASKNSTTSYLSALTAGFDDNSDNDAPPQARRPARYNPKIEFDFDSAIDFPAPLKATTPPRASRTAPKFSTSSMKSAASLITMSELNAVRAEMQKQYTLDLEQFKLDLTNIALEGVNARMNTMLTENNAIIYANLKSERAIIIEATASAVATKVDAVVTDAVARAHSTRRPRASSRKRPNTGQNPALDGGMES
jgi:hypothetical protein